MKESSSKENKRLRKPSNQAKLPFELSALEKYLETLYGGQAQVLDVQKLADRGEEDQEQLKDFGYGIPLLIAFDCNGARAEVVLHTMPGDRFGHERRSDRARSLLLDYDTFNDLPRHVAAVDVGAFAPNGELLSLGRADEFFLLTRYAAGRPYVRDLQRIADTGELTSDDEGRAVALADYLADIHAVKKSAPALYRRRVRDLLGHGEGIMGILDAYPTDFEIAPPSRLEEIERRCVGWRWRIKESGHRLSQVHGDFHPWNVLFQEDDELVLLDRSRGAWGEPGDDLSAMTINYVFFSVQQYRTLQGPFLRLHDLFWQQYLDRTGDEEALTTIQPFYAWRALVVAHPLWYPGLPPMVREKMLRIAEMALSKNRFDPYGISDWLATAGE